ncbi:Importin subunit alpha-2 [Trichoplax sp. H2]|nr:Importin subunit alpha-2 [Trichoplax sp. H2]|eukprot:RDD39471.1 Importin subunit alpha-2 [Trichoplax sp. H2]
MARFKATARKSDSWQAKKFFYKKLTVEKLNALKTQMRSRDLNTVLTAIREFCQHLRNREYRKSLIRQIVDSELVPVFVKFLRSPNAEIVTEASYVLAVVSSGKVDEMRQILNDFPRHRYPKLLVSKDVDQDITKGAIRNTKAVVQAGAVPPLIALLSHDDDDVKQNCLWTIGSIAEDCAKYRSDLLAQNILPPLSQILENEMANQELLTYGAWAFRCLCYKRIARSDKHVIPAVIPMVWQLLQSENICILSHVTWCVARLTDPTNGAIVDELINVDLCKRLIELIPHRYTPLVKPVMLAISNIISRGPVQRKMLVDCSPWQNMAVFTDYLRCDNNILMVLCKVAWKLMSDKEQIQSAIDSQILPNLIRIVRKRRGRKLPNELVMLIADAVLGSDDQQIWYIADQKAVRAFCLTLPKISDTDTLHDVISALQSILRVGEDVRKLENQYENAYAAEFKAKDVEFMQSLVQHQDKAISRKARSIMSKHFRQKRKRTKQQPQQPQQEPQQEQQEGQQEEQQQEA